MINYFGLVNAARVESSQVPLQTKPACPAFNMTWVYH